MKVRDKFWKKDTKFIENVEKAAQFARTGETGGKEPGIIPAAETKGRNGKDRCEREIESGKSDRA